MTPVVDNGLTYVFSGQFIPEAILDKPELTQATWPQIFTMCEALLRPGWNPGGTTGPLCPLPSLSTWANLLAAPGPGSTSQIPPEQVRGIIALALTGGGMKAAAAVDKADQLCRSQLNRHMDFLASRLVLNYVSGI